MLKGSGGSRRDVGQEGISQGVEMVAARGQGTLEAPWYMKQLKNKSYLRELVHKQPLDNDF